MREFTLRGRSSSDRRRRGPRGRWWSAFAAVAVALPMVGVLSGSPHASAAPLVPVTVTITAINQPDDSIDPGLFQGPLGDWYAGVTIGGTQFDNFADRLNNGFEFNVGYVFPWLFSGSDLPRDKWTFTKMVDPDAGPVAVDIQLWDNDDCTHPFCSDTGVLGNDDDQADVKPGTGRTLSLSVNPSTGAWSGDVSSPTYCASGAESDSVRVCFELSVDSAAGDADGDGLFDFWERFGYDVNSDGTVDVTLPGANPKRKDLYLELDCMVASNHSHCPVQAAVNDVVRSFANAPVTNVDGTTGIQLHIDTGNLFAGGTPVSVAGPGGVVGSFGNFGAGGSQIPEAGNTIINFGKPGGTDFFALKSANVGPNRAKIYRYVIFGHQTNDRRPVNDCTSGRADGIPGNDIYVTLGGLNTVSQPCWGTDAGGSSVGTRAEQAGTLLHEFGHLLGLGHGGGDSVNNKPNYLSVMNYSFQQCTVPVSPTPSIVPGGCDYSRNRVDLNESSLDECVGIGQGFGSSNWNGVNGREGVSNCEPPKNANIAFDISGDAAQTPLPGFDDWSNVSYAIGTGGVFADGATSPVPVEADADSIAAARAQLSSLTKPVATLTIAGPASALPGQALTFNATFANSGGGIALSTSMALTNPFGASSTLSIGAVPLATSATRSISATVPSNACPTTLVTKGTATFLDLASVSGSVAGQASTQVLDITPPTLSVQINPTSLWPPNHQLRPISATITATDECDSNPAVTLVSVTSSEPDNGLGDGDTVGDVSDAAVGTDDRSFALRAERAGNGAGRTYTVTYKATDASGNTTTKTATVVVPKNNSGK